MVQLRPKTSVMGTETNKGRHPKLVTSPLHFMIWNWIKQHPGCTTADVCHQLHVGHQRISELVEWGLVRTVGKKGRSNLLEVVEENATGVERDRVEVEITIRVNPRGQYSATARVVGAVWGSDTGPHMDVTKKRYTLMIPKPQEADFGAAAGTAKVIDADYTEVVEVEAGSDS